MEIRARLFPGFRTRSIWFDGVVALLSTSTIVVGAVAPDPAPVPGALECR